MNLKCDARLMLMKQKHEQVSWGLSERLRNLLQRQQSWNILQRLLGNTLLRSGISNKQPRLRITLLKHRRSHWCAFWPCRSSHSEAHSTITARASLEPRLTLIKPTDSREHLWNNISIYYKTAAKMQQIDLLWSSQLISRAYLHWVPSKNIYIRMQRLH